MAYKKKKERQNLASEEGVIPSLSREVTQDVADILAAMFGTPDAPNMPATEGVEVAKLVDMKRLRMAPVPSEAIKMAVRTDYTADIACIATNFGRRGRSNGGLSQSLSARLPHGSVQVQVDQKGEKPAREDLKHVVTNGIPGTAMPSFALLPDQEVEALIDYVKYLSIRGEVERRLFAYATSDLKTPSTRCIPTTFR